MISPRIEPSTSLRRKEMYPLHGLGRCDGHHETVDLRLGKIGARQYKTIKKAPDVPGLQVVSNKGEWPRGAESLDAPILSHHTNRARRGSKRRCVKREAHRPHTEALGSSAQMRCVSC